MAGADTAMVAPSSRITAEEESKMNQLETLLFRGEEDVTAELRGLGSSATPQLAVIEDLVPLGETTGRVPAWHDPQDAGLQVDITTGPARARKLRAREREGVVDGETYAARLRAQHAKLNPRVGWAKRAKRDDAVGAGTESAALLSRAGGLLGSGGALPTGSLETSRLRDANGASPSDGVLRCVQYHPNGQLLLTAALDKRLRFFAVDGDTNPLVQSLFLADLPIHSAAFAAGGSKVLATGRRKYFYIADLESAALERIPGLFGIPDKSLESFAASTAPGAQGKWWAASMQALKAHARARPLLVAFFGQDGTLPLMSLASRQLIGTLKMNGTARSGTFSADGLDLFTSGGDGMVYVWDLRQRACRARFVDEGSLRGTALAVSADNSLLATGSSSGVVNVYGQSQFMGNSGAAPGPGHTRFVEEGEGGQTAAAPLAAPRPKPRYTSLNLTTAVDSLAFSPDAQILAMASRMKRDALRLLHVPTGTVFANWPTSRSPLGYVHALAFSPGGGSLAIGNAKGRVLVYRLHHYPQA